MQSYEARLATYQAISKPKTRAKPAFPLDNKQYPNLTPRNLAEAGFYHSPGSSSATSDTCTCFLCKLQLGGWDPEDDPYEEHHKRGGCAWAQIVCEIKVDKAANGDQGGRMRSIYATEDDLPSSAKNCALRAETFGKWWPHKQKSGWLPTIKNLANAGFIYTPSAESKDLVTCPLCDYSVESWDAVDDPWSIHQTKVSECKFFTATVQAPEVVEKSVKSTKSQKAQSSKRSKRGTAIDTPDEESPEQAAEDDQVTDTKDVVPEQSTRKSKAKPRSTTTTTKSRSTRSKKAEPEMTAVEGEFETVEESPAEADIAEAEEIAVEEEPLPVKEKAKPKPKAKRKTKAKKTEIKLDEEADIEMGDEAADHNLQPSQAEVAQTLSIVTSPKLSQRPNQSTSSKSRLQPTQPVLPSLSQVASPFSPPIHQSQASTSYFSANQSQPLSPAPPPSRPLSQLDRFSNLPASPTTPQSRPKSTLISSQPHRPSPISALPRDMLDKSIAQGAEEARRVIDDLLLSNTKNKGKGKDIPAEEGAEAIDGIPLSDEQKKMTLEQLVRYEMKIRLEELKRQGEEMIGNWEEKARTSRKRLEAM